MVQCRIDFMFPGNLFVCVFAVTVASVSLPLKCAQSVSRYRTYDAMALCGINH